MSPRIAGEPTFREQVWFNWQQPASPLLLGGTIDACGEPFRRYFGFPFFTSVIFYRTLDRDRGYQASWLLRIAEGEACGRLLVDALSVPSFRARLEEEIAESFSKLGAAGEQIAALDLEALGDDEVLERFDEFQRLFVGFYRIGAITEPVTWHAERFFRDFAKEAEGSEALPREWSADRLEAAAFLTTEEPYTLAIERSLGAVASAFDTAASEGSEAGASAITALDWEQAGARHPELAELASAHAATYSWKANNYREAKVTSGADVIAELAAMDGKGPLAERLRADVEATEERRRAMAEDRSLLLERCPAPVRTVLEIADHFGAGLADRRKESMLPALHVIDLLGRELARRSGVPYELVLNLTPGEVGQFIRSSEGFRGRLELRRDALVLVQAPFPLDDTEMSARLRIDGSEGGLPRKDDTSLAEGPAANELLARIDSTMGLFRESETGEVRGTVVVRPQSGALLEGRCRVISDPRNDRLEPGEVLIATSTTPDFMPAIRNAAALLVDQGGTLSHAALTSRELGKPCIVGAFNATSRFHSGDTIRLDFDAGTASLVEGPGDGG